MESDTSALVKSKTEVETPDDKEQTSGNSEACNMMKTTTETPSMETANMEIDKEECEVDVAEEGTSQNKIDPYAYLQRDEFTSEIFKIEINNLPRRFGVGQLRKKLISTGLKPAKIKVMQKGSFAFVNFKCEEDRQEAMDKLEGLPWKGQNLKVKKASPAADPLLRKRKQDAETNDDQPEAKVAKPDEVEKSTVERLNEVISPLWQMSYEEQVQEKEKEIHGFIKRLGREIRRNNQDVDMDNYLRDMFRKNKGLCCPVFPLKHSPVLNDYRNKCEVTIGQSPDGQDKVVGFRLGRYKGGSISVVEPDECVIMPDRMKHCCKSLQKFLQTVSTKPGFEPETKSGHWMMAVLRMNRHRDLMMIVVFHPQNLPGEEILEEKNNLQEYFTAGEGRDTPIKSLYFSVQSDRRDQTGEVVYEHLAGDLNITEDLLAMKFRISPGAFFQVNTLAAEVLYHTIGDWCDISPNTVLLDICCGTGTIGLTLAKRVKKVVGIEMCKEAVEDANFNAKLNNVTNAQYYCKKAEEILPSLIWCYSHEKVVAVVDPPRAGLHSDVIRAIRKCSFVQRLVYVSCKPTGALTNLVDLTRSTSKRVRGQPFKLIQAVPIDLFPHTNQSELLMLFERSAPENKTAASPITSQNNQIPSTGPEVSNPGPEVSNPGPEVSNPSTGPEVSSQPVESQDIESPAGVPSCALDPVSNETCAQPVGDT